MDSDSDSYDDDDHYNTDLKLTPEYCAYYGIKPVDDSKPAEDDDKPKMKDEKAKMKDEKAKKKKRSRGGARQDGLAKLTLELEQFESEPCDLMSAGPIDEDMSHWKATIRGPNLTPYEGGVFHLDIRIQNYPWHAPRIVFTTKIYHPNVDSSGRISLDCLGSNWTPVNSLSTVLMGIVSVLAAPCLDEPIEPDIASVYLNNRARYDSTVREWTRKYAMLAGPINYD